MDREKPKPRPIAEPVIVAPHTGDDGLTFDFDYTIEPDLAELAGFQNITKTKNDSVH